MTGGELGVRTVDVGKVEVRGVLVTLLSLAGLENMLRAVLVVCLAGVADPFRAEGGLKKSDIEDCFLGVNRGTIQLSADLP